MKKLLLGLGTISLITLPLLTIASCSSSTPTLETEKAKLVPQKTLITTGTASQAIRAITSAEDKNVELAKYYKKVTLADGFTYTYESSKVNANGTTLNVTVKITEKGNTDTDITVISITGFTISPFDIESDKLNTETTLITTGTAEEAKIALDDDSSPAPLINYYTQVILSPGFNYVYTSSQVNGTTLNVTVIITQDSTGDVEPVIIAITGFASSSIPIEVARFDNRTSVVTTGTAEEAATAITNLLTLETYYNIPVAAPGFTYVLKGRPTFSNTIVTVVVTITQTDGAATQDATFNITGFAVSTLSDEAAKFDDRISLVKTGMAAEAAAAITNLSTLETYYNLPVAALGFTFTFVSSTVRGRTLEITVTITQTDGSATQNKMFRITDFAASTIPIEVAKFNNRASKVTTGTAAEAATAITNLSTIETYYDIPAAVPGFTYVLDGTPTVSNTTVIVVVTIIQTDGAATQDVTFNITGFATSTIPIEAAKFGDRESLVKTGMAAEAAAAITNLSTIGTYYDIPAAALGFTFTFVSSTVSGRALEIIVTIIQTDGAATQNKMFRITDFAASTIPIEVAKFNNRASLTRIATAAEAAAAITNLSTIGTYYDIPAAAPGFTYVLDGTPTVSNTTVIVVVTITQTDGAATQDVIFNITDFAASIMSDEAGKLITQETLDKRETIVETKAALDDASNPAPLTNYYATVTLADGFTYVYTSSEVNGITLNVSVTITQVVGGGAADVTFIKIIPLTNFALSTLSNEATKFITASSVAGGSGTAAEAKAALDDASSPAPLTNYYATVILVDGFTYVYTSSEVNSSLNTTLDVTVTITQISTGDTRQAKFEITDFTAP